MFCCNPATRRRFLDSGRSLDVAKLAAFRGKDGTILTICRRFRTLDAVCPLPVAGTGRIERDLPHCRHYWSLDAPELPTVMGIEQGRTTILVAAVDFRRDRAG